MMSESKTIETAEQLYDVFFATVKAEEDRQFEDDCDRIGALQARNQWQGHDNLIQWFAWEEWLEECRRGDDEMDAEELDEEARRGLVRTVGDPDRPLAVAVQEGYGTLFGAGATAGQVEDDACEYVARDEMTGQDD
jgi:hypothetical protein